MAASARGLRRDYFSSAISINSKCSLDIGDKQGEVELGRWYLGNNESDASRREEPQALNAELERLTKQFDKDNKPS
ncbi:hypothetical protein QL285_000049 [Trifolium repens]|nr:hypothetical protein QL285_000049 [Trifolium repens]